MNEGGFTCPRSFAEGCDPGGVQHIKHRLHDSSSGANLRNYDRIFRNYLSSYCSTGTYHQAAKIEREYTNELPSLNESTQKSFSKKDTHPCQDENEANEENVDINSPHRSVLPDSFSKYHNQETDRMNSARIAEINDTDLKRFCSNLQSGNRPPCLSRNTDNSNREQLPSCSSQNSEDFKQCSLVHSKSLRKPLSEFRSNATNRSTGSFQHRKRNIYEKSSQKTKSMLKPESQQSSELILVPRTTENVAFPIAEKNCTDFFPPTRNVRYENQICCSDLKTPPQSLYSTSDSLEGRTVEVSTTQENTVQGAGDILSGTLGGTRCSIGNLHAPVQAAADQSHRVQKKRNEKRQEKKAAKTLSAVLLAFVVTWTPYNIFTLINTFRPNTINDELYDFGELYIR